MTDTAAAAPAPTAEAPVFSPRYKSLILGFLLAAYTFNFIDRTIIATIGQAIKVDLKITDTQLGLLGGLSFAVLYSLLGLPLARLAERWNRVSIISLALVVWSGFTAACGLAGNFLTLLVMRVGVGVGEAGCSPPSHSLISDYFEPRRRATALSVYAFGIPLGSMIGAAAGGWLAKTYGWRIAFMVVGAPGVILALLVKLLIREPPRGHSDPAQRPAPDAAASATTGPTLGGWMRSEIKELAAVTANLFSHWPVAHMILGLTMASFAGYGIGQFAPPYFIRAFGLDYATVGLVFGLIAGLSSGLGTLAGGVISDWASRHDQRWYALTPAIGLAIAMPLYVWVYSVPGWRLAALLLFVPGIFHYTYLGPTFGVVQNVVETRRRATASAVMLLVTNIISLGGGPLFTGWIIDLFAQFDFTHPGVHRLAPALRGMIHSSPAAGAHFAAACPGGAAPKGAAATLAEQCKTSLVTATRQGILLTTGFYLWGSLHYLLGSFGLAKRLAAVAAERRASEA